MDIEKVRKISEKVLSEKVLDIKKTPLGINNYNFIIKTDCRKVIAKVATSKVAIKNKALKRQYDFLKSHKALINLAVAVGYSGNNELGKPILYSEFISGKYIDFDKLSDSQIKNFAIEVARIHSNVKETFSDNFMARPICKGTFYDYANKISENTVFTDYEKYSRNIEVGAHKIVIENALGILRDKLRVGKYFRGKRFRLLHSDINKENIIWKGDIPFFVDWDEKIYGDPADEIAYIFAINNSIKRFRKLFLKEYKKHIWDKHFLERIKIYELKNRLFDVVWALSKLDKSSDTLKDKRPDVYREFYRVRFGGLIKFFGVGKNA